MSFWLAGTATKIVDRQSLPNDCSVVGVRRMFLADLGKTSPICVITILQHFYVSSIRFFISFKKGLLSWRYRMQPAISNFMNHFIALMSLCSIVGALFDIHYKISKFFFNIQVNSKANKFQCVVNVIKCYWYHYKESMRMFLYWKFFILLIS